LIVGGVAAVASALERVSEVGEDEYLEAPETPAAIRRAEIVAAARDGDLSKLSEKICQNFRRTLAKPSCDVGRPLPARSSATPLDALSSVYCGNRAEGSLEIQQGIAKKS
jgi:hypothetical protein